MENAVEALKIAFAVMMFGIALAISISSFSSASTAATAIINMRDRETEYTYVKPSQNLIRTVGIETVIPTMYRAYKENIEIYFFDNNGNPLALYYKTDAYGKRIKENGQDIEINYIDLAHENFGSSEEAAAHLDILLNGKNNEKYKNQIIYTDGLYKYLSQYSFEESLGEYQQGTGAAQITKRVITYKIKEKIQE